MVQCQRALQPTDAWWCGHSLAKCFSREEHELNAKMAVGVVVVVAEACRSR
jgi:hypothetical protein